MDPYYFGKFIKKIKGCDFLSKIAHLGLDFNSSILDVGTGVGRRLFSLSNYGFTDLTGTDKFIESDIFYSNGVQIYKKEISQLDRNFDFIMLNHVFEHMPDPLDSLHQIYKKLKPNKYLMIRIPVSDSFAWGKYQTDWVQLDAPRHYFLHTVKSMRILAEKSGFKIERVDYDSMASQFYGSEQYKQDIPMWDERSYYKNPKRSLFSKKQISEFKSHTKVLNDKAQGDAACFYLKK